MFVSNGPKSNLEWQIWGKLDPLFAASAWEGKRKNEASMWADEEFYGLGSSDWADFRDRWERYGLDRTSCLEIGCGAGRLTRPMADYFGYVHAIDVSEDMVAYASRHLNEEHVRFYVTDGRTVPLPANSVTAVFSCHVLQHLNSRAEATAYFQEMSRALKAGGTMMIHLPVYMFPGGRYTRQGFLALWRAKEFLSGAKAAWRRHGLKCGFGAPFMHMLWYDARWLFGVLPALGLERIELRVFAVASNSDPHPFIFATKHGSRDGAALR